jgi:perosamine synthetase
MIYKYPVYKPYLTNKEKNLVIECLDSTWISSKGKFISLFENRFAEYVGIEHAITMCNGTVALHAALAALDIGFGDEVLVPTLTYIASANAVTYTGADVVFVDSEPEYWQMNVEDAEKKITDKTKAIMPVHLYGQSCNIDAILALAKNYSLYIIEDCAEAIGTRYKGRPVGTFGDLACFSFFGNKTITTGEGGMVVTNNATLAEKVAHLKGQGLVIGEEYWHDVVGFNYRMTNICAAIGYAQLKIVDELVKKKQHIAGWYREYLDGLPVSMHANHPETFHSYWMVSILCDNSYYRNPLRAYLKEQGVETRPVFYPIHQMKMYSRPDQNFPVSENISNRGINLPSYPELSHDDVYVICQHIKEFFSTLGS